MTAELPPSAGIVHDSAGRLRLRLPDAKGDRALFESLAAAAMALDGVLEVRANPLTASLLILHERGDGRSLARDLEAVGQLALTTEVFPRQDPADRMSGRGLLAGGLLLLAAVQLLRGQALAPAVTLVWMAAEAMRREKGGAF